MSNVPKSDILQIIDQNLKSEEAIQSGPISSAKWLGKQGLSKITLIIALVPPTLLSFIVYVLKLKLVYILVFLAFYFVSLYWLLETNFDAVINYLTRFKDLVKKYV